MEFVSRPVPVSADLDAILSVMLDSGNPCCWDYPPMGIALLSDRDISMEQYMADLREAHAGHWYAGMCSLGIIGKSQDVSRSCSLSLSGSGQPTLYPDDGGIVAIETKRPLAERPDGSGYSFNFPALHP